MFFKSNPKLDAAWKAEALRRSPDHKDLPREWFAQVDHWPRVKDKRIPRRYQRWLETGEMR